MWYPHLKKHVDLLENVQRRATRLLPNLKKLSYPERLKLLNLPTLVYRRHRGDMIQTYKLINNCYSIPHDDLLSLKDKSSIRVLPRNNQFALYNEQSRKDLRKNFFSNRVTKLWNSLPNEVVLAPNTNIFKNKLDEYWSTIYFKFHYR